MHVIDVQSEILRENSRIAVENQEIFSSNKVYVTNIMSAPGAGKTSVLEETIKRLKKNYTISVIEGDLQTSLDSERIEALKIKSFQITTGNVCHLDARMVSNALPNFNLQNNDLLFIENVGNLVCPVDFDLGEDLKVMVFSVVEGEDKPKKYPVMFHSVDVILLNKIDLIPYSGESLDNLLKNVEEINPSARIIPISCKSGVGLDDWVNWFKETIIKK